ncbi:MAG: hypothetical protein WC485_00285 [Opitutaceae bacterium]
MKTPDTVIRYEDNAEQATVTGWICKTCKRWYGYDDSAKHMASYCCCTTRPCECGGRVDKHYVKCDACRAKADTERYYAREEREWDGKAPLCCDNDDKWFWSLDDLLDHMETDTPTAEQIEDLRLLFAEPHHPGFFDLSEHLSNYISGDAELPGDYEAAEKAVNDYLKANEPLSWTHGKYRPSVASIIAEIEERKKP